MLGKQWLNRYASVDMRGSVIERSQNRQRKLDGVVSWRFDHVMESPPLMLQVALLLLGFALSRYLWEINTTVASVILGFTLSGVFLFLFIVAAGAASVSCPYQTPCAQILCQVTGALHHIPDTIRRIPHIPGMLHPVFSASVRGSICCKILSRAWYELKGSPCSPTNTTIALLSILLLPVWSIADACKAITWLLVAIFRWLEQGSGQQTALLDLHCISWALQTSLDGPVRLSALNYLATITPTEFDPIIVLDCFNILLCCVKVIDGKAVTAQGMEQLATASSTCCLQMLSHLMAVDPTSRVLEDVRRRYAGAILPLTYLGGLPFSHTLHAVHQVSHPNIPPRGWRETQRQVRWEGYKPSSNEYILVARALANIAWYNHQRRGSDRVPCWILRFVFHSLSQSPLPPASVVVDSLSIIAIDLGCGPLKRYGRIRQISAFLTKC